MATTRAGATVGGICNYYTTKTVTNSTLSDNTAEGYGGAIFFYGEPGPLTVVDSTITGNAVVWGDGGGVYISGGAATFANTTFSDNDPNDCAGTGCPPSRYKGPLEPRGLQRRLAVERWIDSEVYSATSHGSFWCH